MKLGAVTPKRRVRFLLLWVVREFFFFNLLGKGFNCPLIGGITILCSWFSITGNQTFLIYNSVHDNYVDWLIFIES